MKKKLAVFDIDGTIFRSSLIVELVDTLSKNGVFPKDLEKEVEEEYVAWVNRKGGYVTYIEKVVDIFIKYIGGKREEDVKKAVKEVVGYQKDKLYVFTRELIKKLKKEGYFLLAISGSPEIIVSEFAKELGFDKFYGSRYLVENGKFSGKFDDIAWSKEQILGKFLEEYKNFNLDESIGVGDSEIDITFLELVKKPIAFNPDMKLAKYAKAKNWRIVVERKNVIYDIEDFDFITN